MNARSEELVSGPARSHRSRPVWSITLILLATQLVWTAADPLAAESAEPEAISVEKAAAAIEGRFEDMGLDQGAFALINGEEELVAGYGSATADTPFVIASVSKSFTALAILQLVENGLIALDSPVTDYINWFTTAEPATSITVEQLLTQTSGLSTLDGMRDAFSPEVPLEQRVDSIARFNLVSEPGAEFHYSNLNYATLGLIVETVTGLSYGAYVQTEIFDPLGMGNTHFDFGQAQANGLATGTISVFGLPVSQTPTPFPGLVPDGYLISTAADMANYVRFQMGDGSFNGGRLLSPDNMALMHTPAVTAEGGLYLDHYAMGWRTGNIEGERLIAHDGNTFGYHADVAVLPDSDAAAVVLVARSGMTVTRLEVPALQALVGGTPGQSRTSTISWIILDVVAALLVLGATFSVVRRLRRRRMVPPPLPRRWPAIVQIVAGVMIGASVVLLAGSLAGGLDLITFRVFWGLAPDVLIVAMAIFLLLIAMGTATIWERSKRAPSPAADVDPRKETERV